MIILPPRRRLWTPASPRPSSLFSQNLILLLPFAEGGGTSLQDVSSGQVATYNGSAPTWGFGPFGPSLAFNGSNNYLNIPAGTVADFGMNNGSTDNKRFSVSLWLFFQGTSESYNAIWSNEDGNSQSGSTLLIRSSDSKLAFYCSADNTDPISFVVPTNAWTHIAVSYASGNNNGPYRIWANGALVRTTTTTGSAFTNSHDLNLMGHSTFGSGRFLQGKLAQFAVWNRAISDAEILQLYNDPMSLYRGFRAMQSNSIAALAANYYVSPDRTYIRDDEDGEMLESRTNPKTIVFA